MEIKLNTNYSGSKTYKTADGARKAVAKSGDQDSNHIIIQDENGRWFPVFIGEKPLQAGVHFRWHVVA